MAYERRGTRTYYYKKRWVNGTCRSEYCGPEGSERARLFAESDDLLNYGRRLEQAQARAAFDQVAATPPELAALLAEARSAVYAALVEAGYHQHKRQWRKKRADKNKNQDKAGDRAGTGASTDRSA